MSGPKYSCLSANLGVLIRAYTRDELETVLAQVEEAERTLIESSVRRENRKKYIDKIAAVIILQGYLDSLSIKL